MAGFRPPNFKRILETLIENRVEFIVIGGMCAVFNGVPILTFDLDIVHSRSDENVERLLAALQTMNVRYREHPKRISPTAALLKASPGHHLLTSDYGPFDVMGTIEGDLDFDALLADTCVIKVNDNLELRLLTLEKLIETKEKTNRDKDRAVLPQLRQTLAERQKLDQPPETTK